MGVERIAIVTAGQPSTNPRALKEARALSEKGYEVFFIYNFWTAWALPFDEYIIKENPDIQWIMSGGDPFLNKGKYYYTKLRHKGFRLFNIFFPKNVLVARNSIIRGYRDLYNAAIQIRADLYIAHNLGALAAVSLAAKKNNSKYAFDAEDYHRGQDIAGSRVRKLTILLEDKYLPAAAYITAASPLITENYQQHYNRQVTVINNVFSKKYLTKTTKESSKPLKLFWFSQTIGKGRGLEDVILALKEMPSAAFSLTLMGKHDNTIKDFFMALSRKGEDKIGINFLAPISPEEIFTLAADHDIGLALEPGLDENNRIALSNKIFTYLMAGNAIIFSDTKAQRKFYEENPGVGAIYECGNVAALKKILTEFHGNLAKIKRLKIDAYNAAKTKYNWEIEQDSLIKIIEKALKN